MGLGVAIVRRRMERINMELDITDFALGQDHFDFSASVAERGANAGSETWHNATCHAEQAPLVTGKQKLASIHAFFRGFGAWSEAELAEMGPAGLNALLIQYVAGDLQQAQSLCPSDSESEACIDWGEYQRLAEYGTLSGSLYRGGDGRVYFNT